MKKRYWLAAVVVFSVLNWVPIPSVGQGNPTCPTRPTADSTNACASTAFVHNVVSAISSPVTSVFGRTGAVVAIAADYAAFYLPLPGYRTSIIYLADSPYNVVGNGTTDNTTGIQAAFTACNTFPASTGSTGCILQFPCGTVKYTAGITSTVGVTMRGCGDGMVQQGVAGTPSTGGTTLKQTCTACNHFTFTTPDAVTIQDLGFEGPFTGVGPFVNTSTAGSIIFVRPEVAPTALPQRGLFINNITTKGGYIALTCQLCGNFSIANNRFYAPKLHGISLTNAALADGGDDTIIANTLGNFPGWADPVGDGILLNTHGGIRIISNKVIAFSNLIHVISSQVGAVIPRTGTLIIDSNSFEEAQANHIRIEQGADATSSYGNIIITSNEFSNSVGYSPGTFQASIAVIAGGMVDYIDFVNIANNLFINGTTFAGAVCVFLASGNHVMMNNNFCTMQNSAGAIGVAVVTDAQNISILENDIIGTLGGQYIFAVATKITHTIGGGIAFAVLPPNSAAGSQIYVNNSAAGGACNGAGAGAMGFFQGGAWHCP